MRIVGVRRDGKPVRSELAFYRCCSPRPVPLALLVKVAGTRWATEENFQAGKGLTGLDEHQVRRWDSWCRWTILAMLPWPSCPSPPPPGTPPWRRRRQHRAKTCHYQRQARQP